MLGVLCVDKTPHFAFPHAVQSLGAQVACLSLSSVQFSLAIPLLPPWNVDTATFRVTKMLAV